MRQKATGTLTVGNIARVAAVRYGDREAIFCSTTGRRFNFREVNRRTNGLANGLSSLGLKKGDVVAFLCTNRAEIVEIYFALAKTGIIWMDEPLPRTPTGKVTKYLLVEQYSRNE